MAMIVPLCLLLICFSLCQVKAHEEPKPCIVLKDNKFPRDCSDVYALGQRVSDVYMIRPADNVIPFKVYCEINKFEAWTVIMSRSDGTVDFNRSWSCYKYGFGQLSREHWLGNDHLFQLTSHRRYRLRVDLTYWDSGKYESVEYSTFRVQSELDEYQLHIGGYSSCQATGYDGLTYSSGRNFTTYDQDNDSTSSLNCAQHSNGGFWYGSCKKGNPTGRHQQACSGSQADKCMRWNSKAAKIMVLMIAPSS